ncbi:MAG: M48 family metallopeptidase [Rhodothermia bacterium]
MNLVGWIVLAALVIDYVLGLVATVLNLRALDPILPADFADSYDEDEYRRSQLYTREKSRLGLVSDTAGLVALLGFWFVGGFEVVDQLARSLGYGEIVTGIIFILSLVILQSILGLPFSIYRTFILEKRFEFNKTTAATFVADLVKSLTLGAVIGVPLLAIVLAIFVYGGPLAWLYCWIVLVLFMLVMQYLAPTLIMPLFNKFETLEDGPLRTAILGYAEGAEFPLNNVFRMDGSKRSAKSNAFFTGFGKNKRVVLFDTLIEQHEPDEIVAIVAHEVGHYKKRHIIQGMLVSVAHSGLMLYLLSLVLSSSELYEAFFVTHPSIHTGFVFFGLLFSPVEMLLSIGMNAWSRRNEFEADRFAISTTGGSSALVKAMKKLSTSNLANLTPHPLYVRLYYSHPPMIERIGAMMSYGR